MAALLSTAACTAGQSDDTAGAQASPTPTMVMPPGVTATPTPGAADGPQTAPELPTKEAALDETVSFDTGIDVAITGIESIDVEAETPGEVSGPAIRVTVKAENTTDTAQSLESAVVALAADDGEPGIGTTAGSPQPFKGSIKPGASASGTYVFMLDPASDRMVSVSVNYAAGEPVAIFTGKVS